MVDKRRSLIFNNITKLIYEANYSGVGLVEEKLIANICISFGCGERIVKECLKHLKIMENIELVNDRFWIPEVYKKSQQEISHE